MVLERQGQLLQETRSSRAARVLRAVFLGLLFASALALRAYDIQLLPLQFHPVRQYRSAFIAEYLYYRGLKSVPKWKREEITINREKEAALEPPIMEHLAALGYRIVGRERLWIPRSLAAFFWVVGGLFLYLLAKDFTSPNAALFSTAFYLFLPFGVIASRSFQPDPLMVMSMLASLYLIWRDYQKPSLRRFALAATVSALAMLVKPVCLFVILGATAFLGISQKGFWHAVRSRRLWLFAGLTLFPCVAYYLSSYLIGTGIRYQAESSFRPHLLITASYWADWFRMIDQVVGSAAFILGLVGWLLFRKGSSRAVMTGMWFGYFVFGLTFSYHTATHSYYQEQLIPIVGLSLAPLAEALLRQLDSATVEQGLRWQLGAGGILLLAGGLTMVSYLKAVWGPLTYVDRDQVTISQEIGRRVDHTSRAICLSYAYGELLDYHGEMFALPWPWRSDMARGTGWSRAGISAEERYKEMTKGYSPDYFIVTQMDEYEAQPGLKDFLNRNFPVLAREDRYVIFDLRRRLHPGSPSQSEP